MARQCLQLTTAPRLGLDSWQGSKACLLESLLLVKCWLGDGEWKEEGSSAAEIAVGWGGAIDNLTTPCGIFRGGKESLGAGGRVDC